MDGEVILSRLKRTLDAAPFNVVANHPEVRSWLGGQEGPLDFRAVVQDPANVCLIGEHGGFICHNLGNGRYEVHSMFTPEGRGGEAAACMREGSRYMFCATDCVELLTKCPDGNRAALGLARQAGFRQLYRREGIWHDPLGARGVSFQSLTFDRWRALDPTLLQIGRAFHDKLENAKLAAGSPLDAHPDDDAHDRAVGASALMVLAGNPRKAVALYNRWAVFAGYLPIGLVSESPVVLDVVDALVAPRNGNEMEVLLCRVER